MKSSVKKTLVAAMLIGLATVATTKRAPAAGPFTDCVPLTITYTPQANATPSRPEGLFVYCSAAAFIAQTVSTDGCPATDLDTIKLWMTSLQAAMYAQKAVRFYTTSCARITAIDVNKP